MPPPMPPSTGRQHTAASSNNKTTTSSSVNRVKGQPKSLKEIYEDACRDVSAKPNSVFLAMLPDKPGHVLATDSLDLRRNYVGDRGLIPVIAVVQSSPQLRRINFAENGLRNNAVKVM
eukprot:PhM_4_TR7558/c0_g1_i1/m.3772